MTPDSTYFKNPQGIISLFGRRPYEDLNKLLNPCCGIGIDKLCVQPCGGGGVDCDSVLNCIGISGGGSPTLFLNQQGNFVTAGGSTPPAGGNMSVQFNDAGSFNGTSSFTWDRANRVLLAGDPTLGFNKVYLEVNDNAQRIVLNNPKGQVIVGDLFASGNSTSFVLDDGGKSITAIAKPNVGFEGRLQLSTAPSGTNGVALLFANSVSSQQAGIYAYDDGSSDLITRVFSKKGANSYSIEANNQGTVLSQQINTGQIGLMLQYVGGGVFSIGDTNNVVNGTSIVINDSLQTISIKSNNGVTVNNLAGNGGIHGVTTVDNNGTLSWTDQVTRVTKLSGNLVGQPTLVAGPGAGTAPGLVHLDGTNLGGSITIATGITPAISSILCTLTFGGGVTYPNNCAVVISPQNATAANLAIGTNVYAAPNGATGFTLNTNTVGLSPTTTYAWNYIVIGY